MNTTYELSKITGLVLPPTILHRESLIKLLDNLITSNTNIFSPYKLILLCAPAGYGKTTLLADFERNTDTPCCWYFLDHTDADRIIFIKRLLASIRSRFPNFGLALDPLLLSAASGAIEKSTRSYCEAIVAALITALESEITERFTIFLCNYQEVNNAQKINEFVNLLLKNLPMQCVLVIESRTEPNLDLAPLIVHRKMADIGRSQLCFTAQQIRELARLQGVTDLGNIEAEQLALSFDGWIAGILLGTRLGAIQFLQQGSNDRHLSGDRLIQMNRHHLISYIVDEVFKQNFEMYSFLKEASVLREMIPSFCVELLGRTDAEKQLDYLEHNGLFITRHGTRALTTYICHSVLRELLYEDLRCEAPDRFIMLHQRASELWKARSNYEQAIYHALEAKDESRVARFILDSYEQMLIQGYSENLANWIDALSSAILSCYPRLHLIRARVYLLDGDHINAQSHLDQVLKTMKQKHTMIQDQDNFSLMNIEYNILRSKILFQCGEYDQVQKICNEVLMCIPTDEIRLRTEVHTHLGVCANLQGKYTLGITELQKALQLWSRNTIGYPSAEIQSALASTYSLVGNFALAVHHISRATACREQLHDERSKINNMIRLGLIKWRQGALHEAEDAFIQALTWARDAALRSVQAYALFNIGGLYQFQGLYEKSLILIEDALTIARQVKDKYLINCTLCWLAMTYLYLGDISTALLLISEMDVPTNNAELPSYEQIIRDLAYGTILLFQNQYEEAYTQLSALDLSLKTIGLKQEQIQVKVRLLACLFGQGKMQECTSYIGKISDILRTHNTYECLVLTELQRQAKLYQAVQTLPEMASLREQLHLMTEAQQALPHSSETGQAVPPEPAEISCQIDHIRTNHPKISIQALGEPNVVIDGRSVKRWRMARSIELFFLLLDRGRPMRKEEIITALWPEVDEQTDHNFHTTFYYLRKALEVPCIVSQRRVYALDLASYFKDNILYDVAEILSFRDRAKQAVKEGNETLLREAFLALVERYQGDYVQPFYSDWCILRRDELRGIYLEAREQLANLAWCNGEFDESILHWQHLLAVDNCLENAHYGLMRCYVQQGKRELALRQYQRCREILQNELAIQPGNAIERLYHKLFSSP